MNDENKGTKFRVDTSYDGLRESLENIIRDNLTTTNSLVIAEVTVRKDKQSISYSAKRMGSAWTDIFKRSARKKRKNI